MVVVLGHRVIMSFLHANFGARVDRAGALRYDFGSSCALDLQRVHELREAYPAIAVGRNTFELDQPALTVREEHLGRSPISQPKRFILTRSQDFQPPIGYQKIMCPAGDLTAAVQQLASQGLQKILLEAGPTLLNVAIQQGVVNALTIYLRGAHVAESFLSLSQAFPHLPHSFKIERLGDGHLLTFDMLTADGTVRQTDGFVCTPSQRTPDILRRKPGTIAP